MEVGVEGWVKQAWDFHPGERSSCRRETPKVSI